MRIFGVIAFLLLISPAAAADGNTGSWHAGIARLTVNDDMPFDILVWYPTQADEVPWQAGPFTMPASRDAPFPQGTFPIVLLSHGGGLGGGTPLLLRELAASLARQGFVVVAPFHGRSGLRARVGQIKNALSTALANPRIGSHLDPTRVGMLGYSLGTTVTLELAGAIPNADHLVTYCAAHPEDAMSCAHAPDGQNGSAARPNISSGTAHLSPGPALKAIALLDPFAVLFQRPELVSVTIPVLIFRPDRSELPAEANASALAESLPNTPEFHVIAGGHFVFTDVCPVSPRATSPDVCSDPPGVDRQTIHQAVNGQLAAFFRAHL